MHVGTAALVASLLVAVPSIAMARPGDDRFYAKAGAFFPAVNSDLRIDGNGGTIGTEIDLENDLGLPVHKTLPFGLIGWRFSDNWRVEAEYFSVSRESNIILDKDLSIGNTTFPVNANITSGLSTDVYRLAVGHSFSSGENYDIGGNIGLHLSDFAVFAEGTGSVNGVGGTRSSERRNQLVPLPTLGLYGLFAINDTLTLVSRINYFQLKISDYKGQLVDGSIGITAKLNRNFGIGADFRYVDYRLRAEADNFTGRVRYDFYGPFVYIVAGF
jgi:hypothetical protein